MNTTEPKTILEQFTVVERAIVYGRVSYDDRNNDSRNLQGQLEMGREHCAEKGYRIVDELPEDDRGASGAEIDLPKLNQIREKARAGEFDVLVVRELDRLSRNLAKQLIVEEELKRAGVRVEYVLAEYDDTPEGRLQKHIRATIAEYEREKIKERMVRGKRNKAKNGIVDVSNHAPFGYRIVDNGTTRTLEIEPGEGEIVKYIFEQYLNGLTIGAIRARLSEKGIPSPSDLRKFNGVNKKSEYGKWARSTIHDMLADSVYAGTWYFGKKKTKTYRKEDGTKGYIRENNPLSYQIEVKVQPLISQEAFDLVQQKLSENKDRRGKPGKGEILLRKRCTCGACSYKMAATGKIENSYYSCAARYNPNLLKRCNQKGFNYKIVDDAVWAWIESILTDEQRLTKELENVEAKRNSNSAMLQSQLEAAEAKISELNQELTETLDVLKDLKKGGRAFAAILVDIERLEDAITQLEAQHNRLNEQLSRSTLSPDKVERLKQFAAKISKGLEAARLDFNLRKAIIDLLDVQVKLIREDGKAIAYVNCLLKDTELLLSTPFRWDVSFLDQNQPD